MVFWLVRPVQRLRVQRAFLGVPGAWVCSIHSAMAPLAVGIDCPEPDATGDEVAEIRWRAGVVVRALGD